MGCDREDDGPVGFQVFRCRGGSWPGAPCVPGVAWRTVLWPQRLQEAQASSGPGWAASDRAQALRATQAGAVRRGWRPARGLVGQPASLTRTPPPAHTQRLVHIQSVLKRAPSYRTLELELLEWQERELFEYFVVVSLRKRPSRNTYLPEVSYQFPKVSARWRPAVGPCTRPGRRSRVWAAHYPEGAGGKRPQRA